jgi:SAM-dependent methyltransferase
VILIGWLLAVVVGVFLLTVLRGAPYVPSHKRDVEGVFDKLYKLSEDDVFVDIGSGDGKVCLAAANRGARAIGYEINPILVLVARLRARNDSNVTFLLRDFWMSRLPSDVTVVYTFGDGRDIRRMADYVEAEATRLGRPLYFLSYAFEVPARKPIGHSSSTYLYKLMPLQASKT